ncbi:hypothetical protein [Fibrella arboris]|uniref:hypothetical protein n=1 Tax=Fibrella arboris TaxID=3242486 RepID=UPI0035212845
MFFDLAKDSFSHDFSISKRHIQNIFSKYYIYEYKVEVLFPIIFADKTWYAFSSYDLKIYFLSEHINSIKSDEKFKEEVIDYSLNINQEIQLLQFLSFRSKERLFKVVFITELERFFQSIGTASERTIVLSILKFFQIGIDLQWNKKSRRFEESGSSNAESFVELVIQYLGIDFSVMNFDVYFLKDYHTKEAVQKYFVKTGAYNRLYTRVINFIPKKEGRDVLTGNDTTYLNVNLYDFAVNDENYAIFKEIGLEQYVLNLYKSLLYLSDHIQTDDALLMRELVRKEGHFFFTKEGSNEFRIGSQLS